MTLSDLASLGSLVSGVAVLVSSSYAPDLAAEMDRWIHDLPLRSFETHTADFKKRPAELPSAPGTRARSGSSTRSTNSRWRDVLISDDVARYEARVERELSPALAAWLANGSLIAGDPRKSAD